MSWYEPSFVYQVYPLGLCGAPHENDGVTVPRLRKLVDDGWVDHMKRLGATCLMLNPVFQSLTHGYDRAVMPAGSTSTGTATASSTMALATRPGRVSPRS